MNIEKEYKKGYDAGIKSVDYLVKKKAKPNIHTMAGLLMSIMDMSYFIYQKDKKTIDKIVSFAKNKAKNNEY